MFFRRRRATPVQPVTHTDDIEQAKRIRAEASREYRDVVRQGFAVTALASNLVERRALNHFGESIQITFTRRGHA
jgi:hypothetical protein